MVRATVAGCLPTPGGCGRRSRRGYSPSGGSRRQIGGLPVRATTGARRVAVDQAVIVRVTRTGPGRRLAGALGLVMIAASTCGAQATGGDVPPGEGERLDARNALAWETLRLR